MLGVGTRMPTGDSVRTEEERLKELLVRNVKTLYPTQEMSVVRKPTIIVAKAELPYLHR